MLGVVRVITWAKLQALMKDKAKKNRSFLVETFD
jgi:hypothetical protein